MMLNSDTCKTARLWRERIERHLPAVETRCGDVVLVVYCARGGAAARPSPREQGGDSDQTNRMGTLQTLHAMETQTRPIEWTLCTVE
jgi:hypothetical protein